VNWGRFFQSHVTEQIKLHVNVRILLSLVNTCTGWFRRKGQYFGRWHYWSLWETKLIWTCI